MENNDFYFNWPRKENLQEIIESPSSSILNPLKEKSINFDKTENIIIIGDNLDALKLLKKDYFNKLKMIYIDPPYNTGNKFIYNDNFKDSIKNSKVKSNISSHSNWLNFIYPRLSLTKELLKDDGVIFISIDDNEVYHLKIIMDEIFGEENFIANFIWESTQFYPHQKLNSYIVTDYILCYAKKLKDISYLKQLLVKDIQTEFMENSNSPLYNGSNKESLLIFPSGSVKFSISDGKYIESTDNKYKLIQPVLVENGYNRNDLILSFKSRLIQNTINKNIENGMKFWIRSTNFAIREIYNENKVIKNAPNQIIFTSPNNSSLTKDRFGNKIGVNYEASEELKKIFNGNKVFDYPKPVSLIKYLISLLWDYQKNDFSKDDIILDFFAGSGTTGHAIWDLNKEDNGSRKFILIQLDEDIKDKEIKKEFSTIADICIERLKRVSDKYTKENECKLINNDYDFGFKVYKILKNQIL